MSEGPFYAVVDDLIGGYAVSLHNKPLSQHDSRAISEGGREEWPIGEFMSKEWAERVASALNREEMNA